jgi:hypothetical protein
MTKNSGNSEENGIMTESKRRTRPRGLDRRIQAIAETDGDVCSLCRKPYPGYAITFGGMTRDGKAALVGECCKSLLRVVRGFSVYLSYATWKATGLTDEAMNWNLGFNGDNPWKENDAAWFREHPHRTHRCRPSLPGEPHPGPLDPTPPGHELAVLVRQIQPGLRIRQTFFHNLAVPIPDIDEIVHAMYDLAVRGREGESQSVGQVAELAKKYASAGQG